MKKLFIAASMLFVATGAFAQTYHNKSTESPIVFGIRGAFNLSNEFRSSSSSNSSSTSSTTSTLGSLPGFAAGFFVEAPLGREFAIQPEIDYSLKGTKSTGTFAGTNYTTRENLGYISVPVLFKYKPEAAKGLNVFAGPEFSFLASAKDNTKSTNGNVETTSKNDVLNNFKKFDFGVDVGAGYDFDKNIGIDVRYGFGITNISKNLGTNTNNGTTYANSLRNGTFQVGLRFLFNN